MTPTSELEQTISDPWQEWNATATDYPLSRCIHELIEAQTAQTPDAVALAFGEEQITYRMLNRRANRVARHLRELGVGPEVMVGVCMERSPDEVVGVLGILKAGGAYVPLDPTYPHERLLLMLKDTQTPVLLTQRRLLARLPVYGAQIVCIDDDDTDTSEADDVNLDCTATADSLAYVIYTSGSTGVPKGVLIDQRGLVNHTFAFVDNHALNASDRVLQFAALSFDASAATLFPPLIVGATLVLPETSSSELMGAQLTQLCERQQVTVIHLPAAVWHQWVDDLVVRGKPMRVPLKVLLVGGESPLVDKLHTWSRLIRHPMTFLNAYGPTEAAITSTIYKTACDEATVATLTSISMGYPLANKQIYLLDEQMRPVPIGVPGEIYVGGVGIARGYLNQPELTTEKFMPDPFTIEPNARMYRTGDLARHRPDGNIEFLGRIDRQVKLRGFRIELDEIEAVLCQHPAVQDAVVLAREDVPGLQRLVAYVVIGSRTLDLGGSVANLDLDSYLHAELRAFLRHKLPDSMVPSAFVLLETLPLTPNGKVDRHALLAPEIYNTTSEVTTAPRTPEESILAKIWAEVLGRPRVGVDEDFFALGGHSLLAARAIALVNATLNRDIPLHTLFVAPTVAAFAQAISRDASLPVLVSPADLAADVVLAPSIAPAVTAWRALEAPPGAIFLTGATGFLGAFLLHELLMQTRANIYCLVRAANDREASRRIQQTLTEYQIWNDDTRSRIVPVVGDLREPQFGLNAQTFQHLASMVDVIYHAGAQVNYLSPYATLKAANVQGTVEILRLACQEFPKPVHYISTIGVAMTGGSTRVYEDDNLADCSSSRGYDQSKWVAEGIVHLARARGLSVAVYRPGRIGGHSQTGVANRHDFLMHLLAGCIQLGLAPDIPMLQNLIPVDYAAQAIIHLSQQPALANTTFHLLNPQPTGWQEVIEVTRELGYSLRRVPYQEWHSVLSRITSSSPSHRLHSLLMLMPKDEVAEHWLYCLDHQAFNMQKTVAGLAGSAIRCPAIDKSLLKRMLADGVRRGLFEAPVRVDHA